MNRRILAPTVMLCGMLLFTGCASAGDSSFEMTQQGMFAGAAGITYGRNIWQHPHPAAVIKGLRAIVHENVSAKDALDIAGELAGHKLM